MWSENGLRRRCDGGLIRLQVTFAVKHTLRATHREALFIQQLVDSPGRGDIAGPIIATVSRTLQGPQLRKAGLPIAQDMLRNAELVSQLANGQKRAVSLVHAS